MDYSNWSVEEAALTEMAKQFVDAVKNMDRGVAATRLRQLSLSLGDEATLIRIMPMFTAIVGHKTSADE